VNGDHCWTYADQRRDKDGTVYEICVDFT
jgi:hypothetical protein